MLTGALLLSVCVINCGYLFEGTFRPIEDFRFKSMLFSGCDSLKNIPPGGANRFASTWVGKLPLPLPAEFLQGIDAQRYDFDAGLPSYLHGAWASHGWWYYYLYAILIKEPLGFWGLVALAVAATAIGWRQPGSWRDEMIAIAPFFALLAGVSSQTGFSVHSRYVIPALPFLFIWASKVGRSFELHPSISSRWHGPPSSCSL